jgi:hypothetical protein
MNRKNRYLAKRKQETKMIRWANAQTAKATVVEISECDKIMDRLAEDMATALEGILRSDGVTSLLKGLIENAKSGIQSMAEEARLVKE